MYVGTTSSKTFTERQQQNLKPLQFNPNF